MKSKKLLVVGGFTLACALSFGWSVQAQTTANEANKNLEESIPVEVVSQTPAIEKMAQPTIVDVDKSQSTEGRPVVVVNETPVVEEVAQPVLMVEEETEVITNPCPYGHENCDGLHNHEDCPYGNETCTGEHLHQGQGNGQGTGQGSHNGFGQGHGRHHGRNAN